MNKYDVFVIDPPWLKSKGGLRKTRPNQGRNLNYQTMDTMAIFDLLDTEIFTLANENHCVFMWTIDQFLHECEYEMKSRGYKKHCRFIWNKLNGIAPAFTVRFSHEYFIWFYKKKLLPINRAVRGRFLTVFEEKSREHSRKPEFSYNMINLLYPGASKMDVFSREQHQQWSQWGNQTDYFQSGLSDK